MRRTSKYKAKKKIVDGITFASQREAARYLELKFLERAQQIRGLELQPRFPLVVNGQRVGTYVADFRYHDARLDKTIVEDAKGMRLPLYKLKKKLVEALYDVSITEV